MVATNQARKGIVLDAGDARPLAVKARGIKIDAIPSWGACPMEVIVASLPRFGCLRLV
jgi:hypothetical protein